MVQVKANFPGEIISIGRKNILIKKQSILDPIIATNLCYVHKPKSDVLLTPCIAASCLTRNIPSRGLRYLFRAIRGLMWLAMRGFLVVLPVLLDRYVQLAAQRS
jgi:hypothetical protein